MQQTLKVEIDKKTIVSKPFDFEAMCLINDASGEDKGVFTVCRGAVSYLFEGTAVTNDVLAKLPPGEMAALCRKTWAFYLAAVEESTKNA